MFDSNKPAEVINPPTVEINPAENFEPEIIGGITFPRVASQRIRSMSADERAQWDADRYRAQTDLMYLGVNVLGFDFQENPHRALFDLFPKMRPGTPFLMLDQKIKKRLILWPRGLYKTTATRVFMLAAILNYPQIRIGYLTGSDSLAVQQLQALRLLLSNASTDEGSRLRYLFPEFVLTSKLTKKGWVDISPNWGSQHVFSAPARTETTSAESTFTIFTPESTSSGRHFSLLVIDDLVNNSNADSGSALKKTWETYLLLQPLLDPGGYSIVAGTRYSFDDTYGKILELATTLEGNAWHISVKTCWSAGDCLNCPHPDCHHDRSTNILHPTCSAENCTCIGFVAKPGTAGTLFPQAIKKSTGDPIGHTEKWLREMESADARTFANQMLNSPLADAEVVFTEALIQGNTLFNAKDIPGYSTPGATTYVCGDLAFSDSPDSDESVLITFRTYLGRIYIVDLWHGHWKNDLLLTFIVRALKTKTPKHLYLEKPQNPDPIEALLRMKAMQNNCASVPLIWLPTGNQKDAKLLRINRAQPVFLADRLKIAANIGTIAGAPQFPDSYARLLSQLTKFPRGGSGHDDLADCLGMCIDAVATTNVLAEPVQITQTAPNWLQRLHQSPIMDESYPDNGAGTGLCCGG